LIKDEEEVRRFYTSAFLINLVANKDSMVEFKVVKFKEDIGKNFEGVKDIFKDFWIISRIRY